MSAFLVSHRHINTIAAYAEQWITRHNSGRFGELLAHVGTAQQLATQLYGANVDSVCHRYKDEPSADIGLGPIVYRRPARIPGPVEIIKAIHCLEYQSCETDTWESSPAYRNLQKIAGWASRELPGYATAPWAIYDPSPETADRVCPSCSGLRPQPAGPCANCGAPPPAPQGPPAGPADGGELPTITF